MRKRIRHLPWFRLVNRQSLLSSVRANSRGNSQTEQTHVCFVDVGFSLGAGWSDRRLPTDNIMRHFRPVCRLA